MNTLSQNKKSICINLIGQKFGKLTVLSRSKNTSKKRATWECLCECGNKCIVTGKRLRSNHTKSCGCIRDPDLTGKKIGRLTLIKKIRMDEVKGWPEHRIGYICKCDCGKEHIISQISITGGKTISCGCYSLEKKQNRRIPDDGAAKNSIYTSYKLNAKYRNIDWKLNKPEAITLFENNCYYCGKEPSNYKKFTCNSGVYYYNGIDRVDNNAGYQSGNVVSCCAICNKTKYTRSKEEFINWAYRIVSYQQKLQSKTIGIKSGCMSILHYGHLWCFEQCKKYCDKLIVLLNDDEYIQNKKGFVPIALAERMALVKALKPVDDVDWFSGLYETEKIRQIKDENPDHKIIVFHSEETRKKDYIPGEEIVGKENIIFIPRIPGSTTELIDKIRKV